LYGYSTGISEVFNNKLNPTNGKIPSTNYRIKQGGHFLWNVLLFSMNSKRFINGNTVFWLYIALCVVDSNTLCKLENTYLAHYSRIYFPKAESRFRLRLLSIRRVPDMAPVEPRNYYKQPTDPCLWPYIHSYLWTFSYSHPSSLFRIGCGQISTSEALIRISPLNSHSEFRNLFRLTTSSEFLSEFLLWSLFWLLHRFSLVRIV